MYAGSIVRKAGFGIVVIIIREGMGLIRMDVNVSRLDSFSNKRMERWCVYVRGETKRGNTSDRRRRGWFFGIDAVRMHVGDKRSRILPSAVLFRDDPSPVYSLKKKRKRKKRKKKKLNNTVSKILKVP